MSTDTGKSTSASSDTSHDAHGDERDQEKSYGIALPSHVAGSGTLDHLIDAARDYAKASTAENTSKAYAADWKHFWRWCRLRGAELLHLAESIAAAELWIAREGYRNARLEIIGADVSESRAGEADIAA